MRGVAALLVLLDHAGCVMAGFDLFGRNLLAVQFFFMLSGFVVACAYENRLRCGMGLAGFLSRRAWRLYPLIVLGSLCGSVALFATQPIGNDAPAIVRAVLLAAAGLPSPEGAFSFGHFPVNPPEWSLFFELLANLAFAVVLARLSTPVLLMLSAILFACYGCLTYVAWPGSAPFAAEFLGAVASFGMGMAVWRAQATGASWAPSLPPFLLSASLVVVCMLPVSLGAGVNLAVTAFVFPVLIAAGASHGRKCGGTASILGELSYPLYILHWPILMLARAWLPGWIGTSGSIALACLAAVAFAWMALVLIDRPMRRWAPRVMFRQPELGRYGAGLERSHGPATII